MGSVTIRNLDDAIKHNARLAAAANGRSLEAELRALLQKTYADGREQRETMIRNLSGRDFVDHMIAITRPGVEDDPFAATRMSKTGDPFDAG